MLLPYSTDAPIYHWPFATLGAIIANSLIFFSMATLPEEQRLELYNHLALNYGEWNPLQWLTSNYLHGSFLHLLGNMIVLWGMGIIVEGKVGWWRFLLIYHLIGILQNVIEQTLMLGAHGGGSLGASGIIYGLIAIALVWAPKNELSCILLLNLRGTTTVDVAVSTYAMISIGIEVLLGGLHVMAASPASGGLVALSSAVLHALGAAIGFAVGVVMLKKKWVDCENWDLFSVLQNRHTMTRDQLAEESLNSEEGKQKLASLATLTRAKLAEFLAAGEAKAALAVHRRGQKQFGQQWQPSQDELLKLMTLLRNSQEWEDAVQLMAEYLQTPQPRTSAVRIALAQILLDRLNRPGQARKVLHAIEPQTLSPKQQAACQQLLQKAQRAAEENPYEVTVDW